MKVALVHDHLVQDGGAEKVLTVMQEMFPDAPTYTLVYDKKTANQIFLGKDIKTSFLQRMPFGLKKYQWYLPLMPAATESYDLSEYDLILSSSSAFSKGVITQPDSVHISYCHSPTRYLWTDTHSYVKDLKYPKFVKKLLPPILSRLRIWDRQAADRVDYFIANSDTVRNRISKYYKRDSKVIYPPVNLQDFTPKAKPGGNYYLAGGRLVPYKRFDLIVKAFNRLGIPLKIFGTGPEYESLKAMAKDHVQLLGYVSDEERAKLYRGAKAFINPQVEDFGITPIESMASGTPVIAFAEGGAVETVIDGETGKFFHEQRWEELSDLIIRFDENKYDPKKLHQHAQKFSRNVFKQRMMSFIQEKYEEYRNRRNQNSTIV